MILFYFLFIFFGYVESLKTCHSPNERDIVNTIFKNYQKLLPSFRFNENETADNESEAQAVAVTVELHIQDISGPNEKSSDFDIDILFSQLWHDPGLSFEHLNPCKNNLTLETVRLSQIWMPNTCILNSKESKVHNSPTDNIMIILYQVRILTIERGLGICT